jgi:hypothetical protein
MNKDTFEEIINMLNELNKIVLELREKNILQKVKEAIEESRAAETDRSKYIKLISLLEKI